MDSARSQQPVRCRHLIGGKWIEGGQSFQSQSPIDGSAIGQAQSADADVVGRAVGAARAAFDDGAWSEARAADRARALLRLADAIEEHGEELATLATREMGKPILLARADEAAVAADRMRYFAGAAREIRGTVTGASPAHLLDVLSPEAVGVTALIMPWNDPIELAVRKLGAALAAGCSVVAKSSELTPATLTRLFELWVETGALPPGTINLVHGAGPSTGQLLCGHPDVDHVSFTGSTATGIRILEGVAATMKPVTLECGGKAPALILPDADLENAVDAVAYGAFLYSGQSCTAVTRVLVDDAIFEPFLERLAARVQALPTGSPLDEKTLLGPMVSERSAQDITTKVEEALSSGARSILPGERDGAFMPPVILTDVDPNAPIAQDEIFGPVLAAFRTQDEAEAVALANDVRYGLSASVWTRDINRAARITRALDFGDVWVNTHSVRQAETSFGGWKQSGLGQELGMAGIEQFIRWKRIATDRRERFHLTEAFG